MPAAGAPTTKRQSRSNWAGPTKETTRDGPRNERVDFIGNVGCAGAVSASLKSRRGKPSLLYE